MDGYECCTKILRILKNCQIDKKPRIVAVTGHVEPSYQEKAIRSGMEQIYSKPIKAETIATILLESGYEGRVS